jgi:inosine-uridine nucleoside N-ribohydrolase
MTRSLIPVFLDTDIGDDIDDALALKIILNSPELDLRGVSTAFVDAPMRACLTQKVLSDWGRTDVPVAAGCSNPLLQPMPTQDCHQFKMLEENPADGKSTFPHGVDFLVEQAKNNFQNTIIAIGPLTNVALALARAPRLAQNSRLFVMGGQGVTGTQPQWNIRWDPEAAAMVLRSGIEIWAIGYDITTQLRLNADHLAQIAQSENPRTQSVARLISLWQNGTRRLPFLHDPLTVLTLISDCVRFEERHVSVGLCGAQRGLFDYNAPCERSNRVQVAVDVDVPRAIDLFMQRILNEPPSC